MRRIGIFLCTILMLFFTIFNIYANAESPERFVNRESIWKEAYKDVLRTEYTSRDIRGENVRYTIWDISGDNQPELIVTTHTCDADHVAAVYTIKNGTASKIGDFSVFTGLIYGDISGTGLYLFKGYMGAYGIDHITYDSATGMHTEKILQGILNEGEHAYPEITDYIPGARRLAVACISNGYLMEEYESIPDYFNGIFPRAEELHFPNDDPNYYMNIIVNNQPVAWMMVGAGEAQNPVPFQELLGENGPFDTELMIKELSIADLNGDGKVECVLDLTFTGSIYIAARLYLCEQDGMPLAFLAHTIDQYSLVYGNMTTDENGNMLLISQFADFPEERSLLRLIFNENECFIQALPVQYYASTD